MNFKVMSSSRFNNFTGIFLGIKQQILVLNVISRLAGKLNTIPAI